MSKAKLTALIAGGLLTLSANSAFATFADLELIRVYYSRSGYEIATDLGKVTDLTSGGTTVNIGTLAPLDEGYAVYFAFDRVTNDLWATGKVGVPSVIVGGIAGITAVKGGTNTMYAAYNTQGGYQYSAATAYYKNNLSASTGSMGNNINSATRVNTEASLSELISYGSGSVTQALYFWDNLTTTIADEKIGIEVARITTYADGNTVITAPTPIPPAFFLMCSGLLGLLGLRRRVRV